MKNYQLTEDMAQDRKYRTAKIMVGATQGDGQERSGVARIFVFFGGGTRPTPPRLASCMQTFEPVAGSWGSGSAPAVSRVMGGAPERNKKSKKYRLNDIWGVFFLFNGVRQLRWQHLSPAISTFSTSVRLVSSFLIGHCILPPSFCPAVFLSLFLWYPIPFS